MNNHIDHIEITNFKSIRHQKIEGCKRINVFIGYPNVGKSNILEAIGLFSLPYLKLADSKELTDFIRVKNLAELFYSADISTPIQIKVQQNTSTMQFLGKMDIDSSYPFRCEYLYNGGNFLDRKSVPTLAFNEALKGRWLKLPVEDFIKTGIKKYSFYEESIIGNNQFTPFLIPPHGNNLFNIIAKHEELKKTLDKEINRIGGTYFFDNSDNTIRILKEYKGQKYSLPFSSMADTFQRIIFYKTAVMSNVNSALLFEEPESHMFPPYIRMFMGDIIYDTENNNQYFINTHSPFVLDDLIEDAQEDLSVFLVDYKNGETTVKRLPDEELSKISKYHVDLFFNMESYLD